MPDRILTSHAGSLPRPEDLIALNGRRAAGELPDESEYLSRLRASVGEVVARQRDTGTSGASVPNRENAVAPVCQGPIGYQGQDDVARDIADMKAAMSAAGVSDGFLNAVAPASCARFGNAYYADDEEMLWACADAMRGEYAAIVESGLILQLDDPAIAENWDHRLGEAGHAFPGRRAGEQAPVGLVCGRARFCTR